MIIFQSTWPQLDISPCSYPSHLVIALIDSDLLGNALFTIPGCFLVGISHIFDKAINSRWTKGHYTLVNYAVYNKHTV